MHARTHELSARPIPSEAGTNLRGEVLVAIEGRLGADAPASPVRVTGRDGGHVILVAGQAIRLPDSDPMLVPAIRQAGRLALLEAAPVGSGDEGRLTVLEVA